MPVEIRELVIRASVNDGKTSPSPSPSGSKDSLSSEQVVKLCVEKILAILKEKNAR